MDRRIYDEINEVVQSEPSIGQNPEILGVFASIGIRKGEPFEPDERMQKILSDAADSRSFTLYNNQTRDSPDLMETRRA